MSRRDNISQVEYFLKKLLEQNRDGVPVYRLVDLVKNTFFYTDETSKDYVSRALMSLNAVISTDGVKLNIPLKITDADRVALTEAVSELEKIYSKDGFMDWQLREKFFKKIGQRDTEKFITLLNEANSNINIP